MTKLVNPRIITADFTEPEPTIDNKLELIKHLSQVQSRIKEDITSDYTYAILTEKDKKFIIESVANAKYGRKLEKTLAWSIYRWTWNKPLYQWEKVALTPTERKLLEQQSENLWDTFMIRPDMTAILSRNTKDNWLMKLSTGAATEEPETEDAEERRGITTALKKLLKKEPTQQKIPE